MERRLYSRATSMVSITLAVLALPSSAFAAPKPLYRYAVSSTEPLPLANALPIPADAATQGVWSLTQPWPLVALHVVVMPDGRVLTFGSPVGMSVQDGRMLDIWNNSGFSPSTHLTIANGQMVDSFCSSAAMLPIAGDVLVSGGGGDQDGYTSFASSLVSPATSTAINNGKPLHEQHWYGTMISLPDGRALLGGGGTPYIWDSAYLDPTGTLPNIAVTPEIFTPYKGWAQMWGASSLDAFGPTNNRGYYPRMWVAPDGTVFGISMEKLWSINLTRGTIATLRDFKTKPDDTTLPNVGPTSTAVMYDVGKIIQMGGNGYVDEYLSPSSPYATLFDITKSGQPVVQDIAPMHYPRQWANSLVLPDGQVLVTGGSAYGNTDGPNAVYAAEIWNPKTGVWTVGANAANYRGYHSATALLPDGTVLSTGGGVYGPVDNFNAEIYYPPYLFTKSGAVAARPHIVSLSSIWSGYGGQIWMQTDTPGAIPEASLIGLSTVTHSFNSFQRRLKLSLTQSGKLLKVTMPNSANLAPPGYYLLTVLNAARVPSPGVIIALNAALLPQSSAKAMPQSSVKAMW